MSKGKRASAKGAVSSRQVPSELLLLLGLLALTAGACGGGTGAQTPTPTSVPTAEEVQRRVFSVSCGGSNSCHSAVGQQAKLDLSTLEASCAALKDAAACELPGKKRLVPFDPENSFLFQKLSCPAGGCEEPPNPSCGPTRSARMPLGGPPLEAERLELVRRWIEAGAPGCP